jgi:antirestriction protein ArdC
LSGSFGTRKYAFEELIAEISAAFSCAALGIVPTVRHADYIASWLEVLREDNRAIVRAASQASKVADYLLGFSPEVVVDMTVERADQEAARGSARTRQARE